VLVLGVAGAGDDSSLDLMDGSSVVVVLGVAGPGGDGSLYVAEPPSTLAVIGVAGAGDEVVLSLVVATGSDKRSARMSSSMTTEGRDGDRPWLGGVAIGLLETLVDGGGLREMDGARGCEERHSK
jgi:hypothetical protein